MDVLGTWKIRDENQNRAKSAPPKEMVQALDNTRAHSGKDSGAERTDGMKRVGAFMHQLRSFEHQPAADVKQDETGYDRRIAKNPGAGSRLYWHVGWKGEILGPDDTAAND